MEWVFECVEVMEDLVMGQKGCSYYFFVINEEGDLCVYTPIGIGEYASPYRKTFEKLVETVCNLKVGEKIITPDLLQKYTLLEVVVLSNEWKVHGLKTVKCQELDLKVENPYQDNIFLDKLVKAMDDIQCGYMKAELFGQQLEEIHI